MTTADSPFQEIAALLREAAAMMLVADVPDRLAMPLRDELTAAASTLDRYAEVVADLPDDPATLADVRDRAEYPTDCAEFVARLRALSSPLTETTDASA